MTKKESCAIIIVVNIIIEVDHMKPTIRARLTLFGANGFIYGLNAVYYCLIQKYLETIFVNDPVTVGILLAIGPFVSIFAPILWGYVADRSKSKNAVLALTVAFSAVFFFLIMFNDGPVYLAVMMGILMFFMSAYPGLIDIITIEYTAEAGISYGFIRIFGTVAFGVTPMILTSFTETNIDIIFYAYVLMAAAAVLSILLAPRVKGHGSGDNKTSFAPIFKDYRLMLLFLFSAITMFTWTYYMNFFPGHLSGTLQQPDSVWGINTFLTVLGEIPFFLAFNRLFDKVGIKKLMLISFVLVVARYAGLATLTNIPALLALGLITGFATTVFTYCASVYINKYIAPENKASANSMLYALGNGIPRVLAGVLGGTMTEFMGYKLSMIVCTVLCAAAFGIFLLTFGRDKAFK